ncbi:MAG TPA: hypothetical protein VFU31_16805 [Candidatus Binatia bacterium]|nr:hypothetical protein [Candidatus Binatia bacterium]
MEQLIETEVGRLPTRLIDDSDTLKRLVIDEIERSLPDIISNLQMPEPLESSGMHLLQYRLRTGRGFRPLTAVERKQSIEQLQHEAFVKSLRKVQEVASTDLLSSATKKFEKVVPEGTNLRHSRIGIPEDVTEIRAGGVEGPEKWESAAPITEITPFPVVPKRASLDTVEDVLIETIPETAQRDGILEIPDTPIELQEPVAQRDVRGLLALLRNRRLLTFVEPETRNLIHSGIEAIEVPDRKVYRALNLADLMSEYHDLVAGQPTARATELRLLDALIVSLENEAQWSRINKRRFHLITKKHSIGLESQENDELQELQRLADMHAESVLPLPFPELAMLKDYARKLGFLGEGQ